MGSSGGVNRPTSVIALNTAAVSATAIPAALTEGRSGSGSSANQRRSRVLVQSARRWRMTSRTSAAASASAKAAVQWSPDNANWFWLDGVASATAPAANTYASMASTAITSTAWQTIPVAA